ncbi:Cof-type HAD-IIB family hydrolase [Nocardioides sp. LHG3406-4]|uniref:Cof-type HAD-IIB family hydrolase n=1 Tax=Nocardioides sp. LHG3406-4 TaxID=2804575 RepID=UPI003CF4EC28
MTPRLVATDLDGTLLHSDGTVAPRTRAVLAELEERGVPVVYVTGRPVRWMETLWETVGDHGLAICSNGAVVYDVAAHRIRDVRAIPHETVLEVARELRRELPGTSYALEKTDGFGLEPTYRRRQDRTVLEVPVAPLEDLLDGTVVKLLAQAEDVDPEKYWRQVEALVGDRLTVTWSSTWALVELSAFDVTKASTLALVCEELGVAAEDVVAFGDMPNDLALLKWAGTSYAMANAHPLVLEIADHVAPTNDDDGVASVLTDLFEL